MTTYETFKINIHGLPFDIGEIQLDNEEVSLDALSANGIQTFVVDKNFSELHFISK
jgi:alpha-glucosidase